MQLDVQLGVQALLMGRLGGGMQAHRVDRVSHAFCVSHNMSARVADVVTRLITRDSDDKTALASTR